MATQEDPGRVANSDGVAGKLKADADRLRGESAEMRMMVVHAAETTADVEEKVAATLARLAEQRQHDADRLRAKSEAASRQAERERQWAAEHRPDS
jgi:uncharacterized coiled-coil DUF342 family protein